MRNPRPIRAEQNRYSSMPRFATALRADLPSRTTLLTVSSNHRFGGLIFLDSTGIFDYNQEVDGNRQEEDVV
jgi:hypothetical protein